LERRKSAFRINLINRTTTGKRELRRKLLSGWGQPKRREERRRLLRRRGRQWNIMCTKSQKASSV